MGTLLGDDTAPHGGHAEMRSGFLNPRNNRNLNVKCAFHKFMITIHSWYDVFREHRQDKLGSFRGVENRIVTVLLVKAGDNEAGFWVAQHTGRMSCRHVFIDTEKDYTPGSSTSIEFPLFLSLPPSDVSGTLSNPANLRGGGEKY